MTTNGIEERLRQHVERLDDPVAPITATEAMDRARPTIPGRWVAGALAAGVVLLALGLVGVAVLGGEDETQVATAPGDVGLDEPPASELAPLSEDVELWLSATEVPPGDHEVVAALWEHEEVHATFGVVSDVERWDGTRWAPLGDLLMCEDLGCTASIDDRDLGVPQIGFDPQAGVPFTLGRFTVAGLEEGWYRISQAPDEEVVASGILRVTADAPAPAPLPPTDAPSVGVRPPILPPAGGSASLEPLGGPEGRSIEDVEAAVTGLAEEAILQRWDGELWATIDVLPLRPADDGRIIGRSLHIPPLEPGAYRLVREGPGAPHTGNLWIVGDAGDAVAAPPEEVPRDHEIRLEDPPLVARVQLPSGLRERPNPRDPGTGPVYVQSWGDPSTGGGVGVSIQPDPGDDAPLFRLPVIGRFETPLGSWTVIEVGEGPWATQTAMLRHDGLVYQVSGGRPGDLSVVRSMAMSLEVERLPS